MKLLSIYGIMRGHVVSIESRRRLWSCIFNSQWVRSFIHDPRSFNPEPTCTILWLLRFRFRVWDHFHHSDCRSSAYGSAHGCQQGYFKGLVYISSYSGHTWTYIMINIGNKTIKVYNQFYWALRSFTDVIVCLLFNSGLLCISVWVSSYEQDVVIVVELWQTRHIYVRAIGVWKS